MNKCAYCNLYHPIKEFCPSDNLRDKLHAAHDGYLNSNWRQPDYSQRLYDGFSLMQTDDNIIVDKFGVPHNSGG